MPSIDELLNNLGGDNSEQAEKTASASETDIERQARELGLLEGETHQTKEASISNDGGNMNLEDLYNEAFGSQEKVASAGFEYEEMTMEKEAAKGELAGTCFQEGLQVRLLEQTIKIAADMAQPDSEATKDIQNGAGVIPGASTANPQLMVQKNRHGESDDTAMDTDPEYYDLEGMDGAVAKAQIEKAIEDGAYSGNLSHKTVQTKSEMPEGGTQKSAGVRLADLSKFELDILQTQYPDEMMKEAYAIVDEESEKVAHLQAIAGDCYEYGQELAMQKIAAMEAKAKEEEEEDEDEDEDSKEEEKTASAMGNFILEGYWNTMMEKGAEYHGDQDIYIEELVKEAKLGRVARSLKNKMKRHNPFSPAAMVHKTTKGKNVSMRAKKKLMATARAKAQRNKNIARGMGAAGALGATGYAGYKAGRD